eukprot:GHVU01115535.1.p1 GENE.GHVU01115535.1~~GHVU01115535.1.p1  ORF type:complete len:176 (+),score=1.22 GHVU01115535.1:1457-1984(+)
MNECATGLDTCTRTQVCVDRDPSTSQGLKFECECKPGFQISPNKATCLGRSVGRCWRETVGGLRAPYLLHMSLDFRLSFLIRPVIAIGVVWDACSLASIPLSARRFTGAYHVVYVCTYAHTRVSYPLRTDIDECAVAQPPCNQQEAYCRNFPGGYECLCKDNMKVYDDATGTHVS